MAISVAVFNNKGGVGKTTLTCNLASFIAKNYGKKILIVDCDAQCNSSQLILGENFIEDSAGNEASGIYTIYDLLKPIIHGRVDISSDFEDKISPNNRFKVDILAGHPNFSLVEDVLGGAWHEMRAAQPAGLLKTNWNTQLIEAVGGRYDIIFYDLGPSLGSINRSILIGCSHFVTPMGSDIFSLYGVRNISTWINKWSKVYSDSVKYQLETYDDLSGPIAKDLGIMDGYLGYTVQQYITKAKGGIKRPTAAYESVISRFPDEIFQSMDDFIDEGVKIDDIKLGDIPHLYSLIPLAQSVASPIYDLTYRDGIVGAQIKQKEEYINMIDKIAKNFLRNAGI